MSSSTFCVLFVRVVHVFCRHIYSQYGDDLIVQLRQIGYPIHVRQLFARCADSIVLLSASCHGLQKLVDVGTC